MWIIRYFPAPLLVLEASSNISLPMKAGSRHYPHIDNGIGIDWHVCRNSNRPLPFIVCRLRKTNFHFLFLFAANKWNLPFSIRFFFHLQLGVHGNGFLEFRGSRNFFRISFYFLGIPQNSVCKIPQNGHAHSIKILGNYKVLREKNQMDAKRKPMRFSLIRSQFAHCANGILSIVRLLRKKQTEVIRLQTDYINLPDP